MTDSKKRPRAKKPKAPRTAGGKKASPEVLAEATMTAREGYRERTEAGHRAAGRTPPSEKAGIVKAAYDIGMMEQAAAILRLAAPQMSAEEIAHLRTDRQAESSLLFANVRVPVLRGLYDTVGDEILAALEKNAAPTPQKPRVPKGPRP